MKMRRRMVLFLAAFLALSGVSFAHADGGEVGLVIQNGDTVTTYCIPYSGDGIGGDQLLKKAGLSYNAFGSSTLAVCSIGDTGCQNSGSFSSCFCQCQGGDCTYWAFFTRAYGKSWIYSALAFNLLKAKDGDVHGWKWGKGAAASAPAPQDITFDQICGHPPQGGGQAATATPNLPTATLPPPTIASTAPPATGEVSTALPSASLTSETATGTAPPPTVLVTINSGSASPSSNQPTPAPSHPKDDGGGSAGLIAFGAIAAVLLGAIGIAGWWRMRRGV